MVAPISRSSAVFSYLRTSVHRQAAGIRILDEDPKTYYRHIAKATFVDVKMKWIRDRGLDHAVEKEKHLKQLIALKDLIKRDPSGRLPVSMASEKKDELGLPTRAIKFIRMYPSVFEEIPDAFSGRLPAVRLTEEATRLDEEEQRLFDNNQQDCADRLLKLLMMTREKRLPLKIIDELRWDLGLPDDHIHRLVLNYPDYFEIVNLGPPRNLPGLEVVCWSRDLAVSVLEKNATNAITGESYRKGMPLSFPMSFPNGYDLEKKVKRWVEGWQKLPYISPYEDASHLDPKSDLGEKWVVGVLHELFHLFISKKTERKNVLLLGEHLGFRPRFARAFAHHPGIFYSSNKIKTSTIVLREAYKRDLLVQKHPLFGMRFQYISLMKKSQTGTKSTVGLNPSESSGEEDDENEVDQAQDEDTCFSSEDENSTESEGDQTEDSFASNQVAEWVDAELRNSGDLGGYYGEKCVAACVLYFAPIMYDVLKILKEYVLMAHHLTLCTPFDYVVCYAQAAVLDADDSTIQSCYYLALREKNDFSWDSIGLEPFVSHESLLQLHHFLFVLGITHVIYCCTSVALAMVKIYSWSSWEDHARNGSDENSNGVEKNNMVFCRHSTFVFHHTSHPWSKNKVLIWMLCFFRQFWSSVNKSDYLALRLGFVMKHNLPLAYNFHSYILRSMEDEFRDIVGLSLFLWGYAVLCIFLNFHGTNMFFWLSFAPAILILLVGTKLHHIVVQLALETMTSHSGILETQPRPRDELFWFRKPKVLLWLIQFISFQNAFEMATFIWSLWEIRSSSCFVKNRSFLVTRLASGILVQFWSSFGVFPLYVIVTQMGSKCKKALISENVRESLHGWRKRVKNKTRKHHTDSPFGRMRSITSFKTVVEEMHPSERSLPSARNLGQEHEAVLSFDDNMLFDEPIYDTYSDEEDEDDEICLLSPT